MSMTQGTNTLLFSYDASGKVIAVNFNGTYYYYLRNGQGDIVKLIDNSGAAVVEYLYDTWGKQFSCTGSLASTLGALNPFRYRGYVYDEETQWYYLQSRYYDPETGRFISADVMLSTGQGVLGNNVFVYCLNNPGNGVDSGGSIPAFSVIDPDNMGRYTYALFDTMDEAAIAFAYRANKITAEENVEVCAFIFSEYRYNYVTAQYQKYYYISYIYEGEHDNVICEYLEIMLTRPGIVGFMHTHPNCNQHSKNEYAAFSCGDCWTALFSGVCYMSDTASGKLYKLDGRNALSGLFNKFGINVYVNNNLEFLDERVTLVFSGLPIAPMVPCTFD